MVDTKPDRKFAARLKKRLEKAVLEFEEINERIKTGRMHIAALTPDLLKALPLLDRAMRDKDADYDMRSKAIRAGLERERRKGRRFGGTRHKPKFNRKLILQLAGKGRTQKEIAAALGCSQPLVSRLLKEKKSGGKKQ